MTEIPNGRRPRLWRSEFRSVLVQHLRHSDLARSLADDAWATATALVAEQEAPPEAVLDAALAGSLSAYDAEFAALATHLGVPLVTDDKRLRAAVPALAVSLDAFTAG